VNILLAIDESDASAYAVEQVAERAWSSRSLIEVLNVIPNADPQSPEGIEYAERSSRLLEGAVGRLERAGLRAHGTTLTGNPRELILERAAKSRARLIIVGSPGGDTVRRYFLGSVSAWILAHAECSVEIVRKPAFETEHSGYRVLVATDGSEASKAAARFLAERPWRRGTEFRVLSVLELVLPPMLAMFELPGMESERVETARQEAMRYAEAAVRETVQILRQKGLPIEESISVLLQGPRRVILDEARQWGADLIVLGSHGRRGVDKFLLGSVSESVAMHAPCSVEVVRAIGA
jgi:nucleotide-binding universal stress UspA family protein